MTTDIRPLTEQLLEASEQADSSQLKTLLAGSSHSAIARAIEAIPSTAKLRVWDALEDAAKAEVLLKLHGELRRTLIRHTPQQALISCLSYMQSDELADIDDDLPADVVDAMVAAMDTLRRERYASVRDYPDDSAGGLMDTDATVIRGELSLRAVLRYLRLLKQQQGQLPEHLDSLMVVDRDLQLIGTLPLSTLVSHDPDARVIDLLEQDQQAIPVTLSQQEVAQRFQDEDLLSAPVVDANNRLLGRITVDDIMDVIQDQADRKVLGSAGLDAHEELFPPILKSSLKRGHWLGINLITAFLGAWVIGLFDKTIEELVALAILMPVVASMGGVAGTQTLTLITRALALQLVGRGNLWQLLLHEGSVVALNGLVWSLVVALIAQLWFGDPVLGFIFGLSLLVVILAAVVAGIFIPLLLDKVGVDPALAGGVILTTITDATGFFTFLGLASVFM